MEVNKIDNRKIIERIDKTKIWFFKKLNKIHKHLVVFFFFRKKEKRFKYIKLEMKKETLQLTTETHRIIRDYYE